MALRELERRNYGGKWPVSIKYQNLYSFKEGLILLCEKREEKHPWNEKKNTFTLLTSLYNPVKFNIWLEFTSMKFTTTADRSSLIFIVFCVGLSMKDG